MYTDNLMTHWNNKKGIRNKQVYIIILSICFYSTTNKKRKLQKFAQDQKCTLFSIKQIKHQLNGILRSNFKNDDTDQHLLVQRYKIVF